jgi:lipopolysaccharide/colanic/teichoic acid biosynthesis glycosyltransferase
MTFVLLAVAAALLGLIVNELYGWLPWLGARLVRRAARFLPDEYRERYEEEWLAELQALPTRGLASVFFAVSTLVGAPKTARALSGSYRSPILRRALDLSASSLGLLLLSPVLVTLAVAIRVAGRGPVMFRQLRVGAHDRVFHMLKFRTMHADADRQSVRLTHVVPTHLGLYSLRTDPRVTPVGRFLRRTSLDELPQLVNVMRGEMALVGPRPRVPDDHSFDAALAGIKPGLTSWTSVAHVGLLDVEGANRRDLELAHNWSLRRELRLVLATVRAVLYGR